MNSESISNFHILPGGICDFSSGGSIFLFLEYPVKTIDLLNQITQHIQNMDLGILNKIEKRLNLQLRSASWDLQGNVCFADDSDLRPEYRTNFHAMDLWDYYYAVWHSQQYWKSIPGKDGNLPLPHPDYFWKTIRYGTSLREIHSLKTRHPTHQITLSDLEKNVIQPMDERFKKAVKADKEGRLYLNEGLYVDHISSLAWEYQLAGVKPLPRWFRKHINQPVSSHDLVILAGIIESVEETYSIQTILDHILTI